MPTSSTFVCACCTSGSPCTNRCYLEFDLDFDCNTGDYSTADWVANPLGPFCSPSTISTALQSKSSADPDFACSLFKYVPASGTACCTTGGDCTGRAYVTPAFPTLTESQACCCCDCPGDCNGCGDTRTVTIAGTGGAYDGGGNHFDGTFMLRACAPRAAGDPCTDTKPDCQWFLDTSFETGGVPSGNNDIVLFCTGPDWGINLGVCTAIVKRCCPTVNCPPSGAYVCNCAGVTVSLS